ncbi:GIY-YIG nuclease family protein [Nonlabens sp. Asnod3-H03]|uniref:GIY-YIG nuclease family protein n=1 Tax=Nonlabens sp. Asnod3-H03 TaxID=3160580 RepID=UPI00386B0515
MIKIYVLRLENEKYYVGQTTNVEERFKSHKKGKLSSDWTKLNNPIDVIDVIETRFTEVSEAMFLENSITIEFMKKYGWKNVRGGDFCTLDIEKLRFLLCNNSDLGNELLPITNPKRFNLNYHGVFVFVLKLKMDKFFVGIARNIKLGIIKEYNKKGHKWCEMYEPIELISVKNISKYDKEKHRDLVNNEVISIMKETNWRKVRGGDYFEPNELKHRNKVLRNTDIKIEL